MSPRQSAIATSSKSSGLHVNFTRRRSRGITLIARKTSGQIPSAWDRRPTWKNDFQSHIVFTLALEEVSP
jgi:hypothetical protein